MRGRRARYIGALRLYLTMSLLFFALSAILPNPNPDNGEGVRQEAAVPERQPTSSLRGWARVREGMRLASEHPEQINEVLAHTFPRMMFVLVPIFAVLLRFAYRNRGRRYPQFLHFSLHFHAAVFACFVLTVPLQTLRSETWLTVAQAVVVIGAFGYLIVALKRVFGGGTGETLGRASVVAVTYGVTLAIAIVTVVILSLYGLGSPAN